MYSPEKQRALFELSKQLLQSSDEVSKEESARQATQLHELILYHEWRYYVLNDPVVSDFEYDRLYKKLEELEAQYPNLKSSDSPTQRVSSDLTDEFQKVTHLRPMLSLANSYNAADLIDFDTQVKKLGMLDKEAEVEYMAEPKFDGGSIAVVYENDRMVRAATRGNGFEGEEITNNIRTVKSIPLKTGFSKFGIVKAELRGEAVIRKDRFKKMNKAREQEGLSLFANPRNTATGGLRTKDPKETANRHIDAFVYQLGYAVDARGADVLSRFKTHEETIEMLEKLGLKVSKEAQKVCKNIREVIDFCLQSEAKREEYPYEIDGMVVKVNSLEIQQKMGYTSHHPRWAIAFKFKAKQATTKMVSVEYQVGKIGSVTPVAKLEPVQLAGVTVSSVSLHNEDFIINKDIRIGDTVLVERAGDVIPYIVKPMKELRNGTEKPIEYPTHCPVCQTKLLRSEGEAAWRCVNDSCEAQVLQRMIFHVSKDAMDIDGLGKSIIERFYELGWVKNIADLYRLDYEKIAKLEGFGEKSAANLQAAIEQAKKRPIHRLLHSLSIHHLGKKVSQLLAAEIDHVLELKDWKETDFTNIKDVGPIVAENVIAFFENPKNVELLIELESLGVNLNQTEEDRPKAVAADAPLRGKTILFTGTLQKMNRKEAQAKAETAGAKNISAVSSNLNILVAGEKAGSKLRKAKALGTVEILTEEAFLSLVGEQQNG